ncbi:head GIN domain-containing protein [Hymenobacter sp. ASUV-10]|uniref:Head GIN domain-containing protein n=1 Tax=Hymenobacter aranciens TaxID=3063996 RepID=A0ABT9BBW5_9BACT|nr:head GIN domain-containing protein [Hymenobacter sp. ASUV-10]MDO7875760.1 head GIN domain-containing protein [Hymenobacter sp. ASUV-10]
MQIQGSGILAVRTQLVSSFTRLHLSVHGHVELVQGDEEKVVVEADDNLLEHVGVTNAGRTLYVTTEDKLRRPAYTQLRITVYLRQIDHLDVASQGTVRCANALLAADSLTVKIAAHGDTDLTLETPKLLVKAAAHGNIILRGRATEATLRTASHGDLDASELVAGHLNIRNAAHGNIRLYATDTIAIQHVGHGYVHYAGPARLTDVGAHGQGEVRHVVN